MTSSPGLPTTIDQNRPENISHSPAEFAREAVREYRESPEKPESIPSKVIRFLSESIRILKEKGVKGFILHWIEKALNGIKEKAQERWKLMIEITKDTFLGPLFGLGDQVGQGLEKIQSKTLKEILTEILTIAFGNRLNPEAITALTQNIGTKIKPEELLALKNDPTQMREFLLKKAKEGQFALPKEILMALGVAPALIEGAEALKDSVAEFDRESGLSELRLSLTQYLNQNHPGWNNLPSMAWMRSLDNPRQIAQSLNINLDQPEWRNALRNTLGIGAGLSGGFLLLRKLMGPDSRLPQRITVNAALYMFLKSSRVHEFLLQGVEEIRELEKGTFQEINELIHDFLGKYGLKPEDIGIEFESGKQFGIADGIQAIIEFSHENPGLALVGLNVVAMKDFMMLKLLGKFFAFVAEGGWKLAGWAKDHPEAAAALVGLSALSYVKKREIIQDLAQKIYPKNKEKREEFLEKASKHFDLDFEAPETYAEKVADPLYERLISNPLEFLADGELKLRLFNDMEKGLVLWKTDSNLEKAAIGLVVQGNPIWHSVDFGAGVLESLIHEFCDLKNPDGNFSVGAVMTLGAEGYVIGKVAQGALKGYKALFNTDVHGPGKNRMVRFFKTIIPFSKENRYLWYSALRSIGDNAILNTTDLINGFRIARVTSTAREMMEAAARNDRKTLQDKVALIKRDVPDLTSSYRYADDIEVDRSLRTIEKICDDLNSKVIQREDTRMILNVINEEIHRVETRFSRLLRVGTHFREGNVRLALKEVMTGLGISREVRALAPQELFENTSEEILRSRMGTLEAELSHLPAHDPERIAKQRELFSMKAYLDPQNPELLKIPEGNLDQESRALRVKEMAAQVEAVEKGTSARVTQEIETILEQARSRGLSQNDPQVKRQLQELDERIVQPFWNQKKKYLATLHHEYKKLPRALRTPELKAYFELANENSYLTRVVQGAKGRAILAIVSLPLMFGMELLSERDEAQREYFEILKGLGPEGAQLILDCLPGVGTYSNFHTAVTGEELVSGRKLEGWERWSNWLWGSIGLAGDTLMVLSFIPSGSTSVIANMGARLALTSAKGSKLAARITQLWPRMSQLIDRMGGLENFAQSTHRFLAGAKEGKLAKNLRRVEIGGMAAATTITLGGTAANLIYTVEDGDEGFPVAA